MDLEDLFQDQIKQEDEVREYVLSRPLFRPSITYKKAILWTLLFLTINAVIDCAIILPLWFTNTLASIESYISPATVVSLIVVGILLISLFIVAKPALIGLIHLYQHYAKEETRRKCLCKPTCSEYAEACLRKYNLFKALHKIRIRCFKTCGGTHYIVDEP